MPPLTKGQEEALVMIKGLETYEGKPKRAVLAGYAGSGKTYLLHELPGLFGRMPTFVAPTGKAAARIREAAGVNSSTIHSWLYNASEDPNTGEVSFSLKEPDQLRENVGEIPILVIDEASMVGEGLWDDVYEACCILRMNILLVGDPFQLPPVQERDKPTGGGDENGQPRPPFNLMDTNFEFSQRTVLTEIVRQATESPIIRATMLLRDGHPAKAIMALPRITKAQLPEAAAENWKSCQGVVIAHKNETRMGLNLKVRERLGKPAGVLTSGEPMLILQNSVRAQVFNGETPIFTGWSAAPGAGHQLYDSLRKEEGMGTFGLALVGGKEFYVCPERIFGKLEKLRPQVFSKRVKAVYGQGNIDEREARTMSAVELEKRLGKPYVDANLGYCLTAHKAQGSEWEQVIVCLESSVNTKNDEGLRWLYTSLTRSRSRVQVCLGGL